MKEILFIVISGIIFISCSSSKSTLSGKYYLPGSSVDLVLNTDSTFYVLNNNKILQELTGEWDKKDDNLIVLNSIYDPENLPITVKEEKLKNVISTRFKINILGKKASECFSYQIWFDGKSHITRNDPFIIVPMTKKDFDFFTVRVLFSSDSCSLIYTARNSIATAVYKRKNMNSNYFEINIPFEYYFLHAITVKNDSVYVDDDELYWERFGEFVKIVE